MLQLGFGRIVPRISLPAHRHVPKYRLTYYDPSIGIFSDVTFPVRHRLRKYRRPRKLFEENARYEIQSKNKGFSSRKGTDTSPRFLWSQTSSRFQARWAER